ncbi:MAG: hypothetical protein IJ783_09690 [Kiritimatiellae bacterium]|nr:hypothetical protein [Kiritimatiellia bacterium]
MFHRFPSRPAPSPGSVGRADRGVSGSLLAETLLVLPVYLMLLGGLFVVGDILLARIRGGVLDRTAAWLRPGGALGNHGIAQHHRVWEGTDSAFGWYGMKLGDPKDSSVAPVRSWGVSLDDNSSVGESQAAVPTVGNRWAGFYQGVSFVSAGVPFWVSWLDSQRLVHPRTDSDGDATPSVLRIHPDHPGWKISGDEDARFGRSYVFTRRNKNMKNAPPERSAPIREEGKGLRKEDGGFMDIVFDTWAGVSGVVDFPGLPIPDEYVRNAAMKTIAEQNFGKAVGSGD